MTERVFKDDLATAKPHAYGFSHGHDRPGLPTEPIEVAISSNGENWQSYYDNDEFGRTFCYDWDIPLVNPVEQFQKINTRDGQNLNSSSFDSRDITTTWIIDSNSKAEFLQRFHEIQKFFMSRDGFWLSFGNQPAYKYRVKTRVFTPTYFNDRSASISIIFNNYTGMKESTGTSLEIFDSTKDFFDFGMGIPNTDNLKWKFNTNNFNVFNPSDLVIDPLSQHHFLKIHIKGVGIPTIVNKTTGETFSYSKYLSGNDELVVDGVDPVINGIADGINSNHGTISLNRGYNEFDISGLSNFEVSFEFYFIYF
ncbi:phage tail family protein [Companilactobacillus allii]|uniref:Siphovirus-type tail component RIFT-related domain-containing protein n=1 Tax=Companilactobacillus allii TaxID=1847728 RepID=A0A1P8Q2R7_9LACO|nr:phage tail domain-containing protein [Companilactobacillus allii]APX72089.1 hypothetical protein BTM29_05705 [Companilactobacillus allii]USQ69182.1 phage tail family protein [Companilactobacillus allii]